MDFRSCDKHHLLNLRVYTPRQGTELVTSPQKSINFGNFFPIHSTVPFLR